MSSGDFEKEFAGALAKETAKQSMEIVKATLIPTANEIGKGIGDLAYLLLSPVTYPVQRLRIMLEASLSQFRKKIEKNINEIPVDKLCEPDPQIVYNSLHDAQGCFNKEGLQEMFASLIASSANQDKADQVHPSFSSIIRQMSPLDAENLLIFRRKSKQPIAKFYLVGQAGGGIDLCSNVFLENPKCLDIEKQSISLEILESLGLISLSYLTHLIEESYDVFERHPRFVEVRRRFQLPNSINEYSDIVVKKGTAILTDKGQRFLTVCS